MKLARFAVESGPRLGLVRDDEIVGLTAAGLPYARLDEIIRAGDDGFALVKTHVSGPSLPLAQTKRLAPMSRPGKYLAIGLNYRRHLESVNLENSLERLPEDSKRANVCGTL